MSDFYTPASEFLIQVANGEIPLTGSSFADQNLHLLIAFMTDQDTSNRDWATLLVAGQEIDTPEVRQALLHATQDDDASVRAEALLGLAEREAPCATPLIVQELGRDECGYGTFQAAHRVADSSLLDGLRRWRGRGSASWINNEIEDAIRACEARIKQRR